MSKFTGALPSIAVLVALLACVSSARLKQKSRALQRKADRSKQAQSRLESGPINVASLLSQSQKTEAAEDDSAQVEPVSLGRFYKYLEYSPGSFLNATAAMGELPAGWKMIKKFVGGAQSGAGGGFVGLAQTDQPSVQVTFPIATITAAFANLNENQHSTAASSRPELEPGTVSQGVLVEYLGKPIKENTIKRMRVKVSVLGGDFRQGWLSERETDPADPNKPKIWAKQRIDNINVPSTVVVKKTKMSGQDKMGYDLATIVAREVHAHQVLGTPDTEFFPKYYTHYIDSGFLYLVMGVAPGTTITGNYEFNHPALAGTTNKGKVVVAKLACAMWEMWNKGWSHGDHNGDNLLLGEKYDTVTIIDFGIAAHFTETARFRENIRNDVSYLTYKANGMGWLSDVGYEDILGADGNKFEDSIVYMSAHECVARAMAVTEAHLRSVTRAVGAC